MPFQKKKKKKIAWNLFFLSRNKFQWRPWALTTTIALLTQERKPKTDDTLFAKLFIAKTYIGNKLHYYSMLMDWLLRSEEL